MTCDRRHGRASGAKQIAVPVKDDEPRQVNARLVCAIATSSQIGQSPPVHSWFASSKTTAVPPNTHANNIKASNRPARWRWDERIKVMAE